MAGPFDIFGDDSAAAALPEPLTTEEKAKLAELESRIRKAEERVRLEALLLDRLKQRRADSEKMLQQRSGHWGYEDCFYRFYHGRFKVYGVQSTTERAVKLLGELLPERKPNLAFDKIIREGTSKQFELAHNREWDRHTRPMLEAVAHAKFMIEMAVRYADLPAPPQPMPSGWASLLYLFDLR